MSEEILKFDNIRLNKKEFHKSKLPVDLKSVSVDQIVVSEKFTCSDNDFKYFIGYQEDDIVKPLCIIFPQMSGYIKYFENGGKNMSFIVKNDNVLDKYNKIQDKIKKKINIKFHSMSVYDKTHMKAKVRELVGVVKASFLGNGVPKESMHYTCIVCVTIDSVMIMEKKLSAGLFRRM